MSATIDLETIRDTLAYIHDDLLGQRDLARTRHAIHLAIESLPKTRPGAGAVIGWRISSAVQDGRLSPDNDVYAFGDHVTQDGTNRTAQITRVRTR